MSLMTQMKNVLDLRKEMERRLSQRQRMLQAFKTRRQLTNLELARISYRYSARLGELRKEHNIVCEYVKPGVFRYTYVGQK